MKPSVVIAVLVLRGTIPLLSATAAPETPAPVPTAETPAPVPAPAAAAETLESPVARLQIVEATRNVHIEHDVKPAEAASPTDRKTLSIPIGNAAAKKAVEQTLFFESANSAFVTPQIQWKLEKDFWTLTLEFPADSDFMIRYRHPGALILARYDVDWNTRTGGVAIHSRLALANQTGQDWESVAVSAFIPAQNLTLLDRVTVAKQGQTAYGFLTRPFRDVQEEASNLLLTPKCEPAWSNCQALDRTLVLDLGKLWPKRFERPAPVSVTQLDGAVRSIVLERTEAEFATAIKEKVEVSVDGRNESPPQWLVRAGLPCIRSSALQGTTLTLKAEQRFFLTPPRPDDSATECCHLPPADAAPGVDAPRVNVLNAGLPSEIKAGPVCGVWFVEFQLPSRNIDLALKPGDGAVAKIEDRIHTAEDVLNSSDCVPESAAGAPAAGPLAAPLPLDLDVSRVLLVRYHQQLTWLLDIAKETESQIQVIDKKFAAGTGTADDRAAKCRLQEELQAAVKEADRRIRLLIPAAT